MSEARRQLDPNDELEDRRRDAAGAADRLAARHQTCRIRRYRPGDDASIVALMNRSFGADPLYAAKSVEWWRWKYLGNPAGHRTLCLEADDGRIVGHYGGSVTSLRTPRGPLATTQICDACIDPVLGVGLRRIGLFVRLARSVVTFAEPADIAAAYGLPVPDHFLLGSRLVEYWILRTQPVLVCRSRADLPRFPEGQIVEDADAVPEDFDGLSPALARAFPIQGDRSPAFQKWRFFDAPGSPYRAGTVRSAGSRRLRGVAYYRSATFLGRRTGVIMDWLVPPEDREAGEALLHWAAYQAVSDGLGELVFLCPPTCAWAPLFQSWGFFFEPTHYTMVFRPFDPALDHQSIRRDWYYTLADLDAL